MEKGVDFCWCESTGGGSLLGWVSFLSEGREKGFGSSGGFLPRPRVGKTLMFDYLTKNSIISLKEFTVNNINCIVLEWNLSLRTQK